MNKLVALFIIVHVQVCCCFAQSYIGLNGGGGLGIEQIAKGAIPYERELKDYLSLGVELGVTIRQNQAMIRKINSPVDIYFLRQSYVELPFYLKLKLPIQDLKPYIHAGGQIGYGLNMWYHYRNDRSWERDSYRFKDAGLKRLDAGVILGGGIEKELVKRQKIFLDLRYYLGLINLDKDPENSVYNEGLVFSIGCLFPINL